MSMFGRQIRGMRRWSTWFVLAFVVGCSEPTGIEIHTETLIITQNPAVFAEELARIDYNNAVFVRMKDASVPGRSLEALQGPHVAGVIGLPDRPASTFTRTEAFASASPASRQAVVDAAAALGAEVYGGLGFPILQIRMSDAVRLDVVTVLMSHANVDFIEANRPSVGVFDGG